jgi:hypothetical protein
VKQTLILVGDLPNKLTIREKIEPLGSQRVGLENKQPRVTRLEYLVVPFSTGKC